MPPRSVPSPRRPRPRARKALAPGPRVAPRYLEGSGSGLVAQWVYAADTSPAEMALPADDGAGNPVAIEIPANAAGYLLMHNVNPSDQVAKAQVTINAEAVDGPLYTKSSTFTTYDSTIAVPPLTDGYVRTQTCAVPAAAQFWRFTTHTHGRATASVISEGADVVFETFDWAQPGSYTITAPPFRTFASAVLTASCTFNNPFSFTLRPGGSYQTEEPCVAVGYFFPAEKPLRCINGFPF